MSTTIQEPMKAGLPYLMKSTLMCFSRWRIFIVLIQPPSMMNSISMWAVMSTEIRNALGKSVRLHASVKPSMLKGDGRAKALRKGAEIVQKVSATPGIVPVLAKPVFRNGKMIRRPGTLQRNILIRNSRDVRLSRSSFRNLRHAETYERILAEAEAGGSGREVVIQRARKVWSQGFVAEAIERFAFYERVQNAFAIVVTGERQPFGNFILRKGVIGDTLRP